MSGLSPPSCIPVNSRADSVQDPPSKEITSCLRNEEDDLTPLRSKTESSSGFVGTVDDDDGDASAVDEYRKPKPRQPKESISDDFLSAFEKRFRIRAESGFAIDQKVEKDDEIYLPIADDNNNNADDLEDLNNNSAKKVDDFKERHKSGASTSSSTSSRSFKNKAEGLHAASKDAKQDPAIEFDTATNSSFVELMKFLSRNDPTKIKRSSGVGVVTIHSAHRSESDREYYLTKGERGVRAHDEWKSLTEDDAKVLVGDPAVKAIKKMAAKHNLGGGKWICFVPTHRANFLWKTLAKSLGTSKLSKLVTSINITVKEDSEIGSAFHEESMHVITVNHVNPSVYDEEEGMDAIIEIEQSLRRVDGLTAPMTYKPDIYSAVGIYRQNEFGLLPTLYRSTYDENVKKSFVQMTQNVCEANKERKPRTKENSDRRFDNNTKRNWNNPNGRNPPPTSNRGRFVREDRPRDGKL